MSQMKKVRSKSHLTNPSTAPKWTVRQTAQSASTSPSSTPASNNSFLPIAAPKWRTNNNRQNRSVRRISRSCGLSTTTNSRWCSRSTTSDGRTMIDSYLGYKVNNDDGRDPSAFIGGVAHHCPGRMRYLLRGADGQMQGGWGWDGVVYAAYVGASASWCLLDIRFR